MILIIHYELMVPLMLINSSDFIRSEGTEDD